MKHLGKRVEETRFIGKLGCGVYVGFRASMVENRLDHKDLLG